ncbi:site-specific DNA-methyltransferase [Novosphingobium sp. PASSN1]|uniref:site-specific DNA-methyltransferase n=1 Tax=Novosphingobium sp. PASSN1 TaxID=2015561 RepID=UPI000BD1A48D|nr:site-specific DNA-methyltransferase [Novosphingobium sp. PASSN1]OYU34664.1 MAG: site-specific DNA-methyltransferase [Novosphingobium sp. PASSN1]
MSKFDELVTKLREIFQIDRPELDFGVYRILNARADEINDYLTKRLREQVEAALASGSAANAHAQQRELDEAIKAATALGADPETLPKVKDLRAAIAAGSSGASDHENAVFSHLLTFFSRYYDKGDFLSQRRYKGDTYAIPYAGEEVVLHWANKDQYYTKSGEAFSNYAFKLDDGRAVRFQLIAADTAKDNRKDNDKDRRFALAEARTVTRIDDEGEAYDVEVVPIAEEDGDLAIRFEYRAFPAKTTQESLVNAAVQSVLADEAVKARWLDLTTRAPTDKNPQRTVLEKHLTTYTQKNTADYFIHKDLGTFLRRELDFYVKNEVMNLDDVQNAKSFAAIEANLRMIQCLRQIAQDLITFLASIEDFQKKLWLKKKFVVAAHYCVTLDRVPEALYDRIAANPAQWTQWHDLGMRDSAAPGTAADLKAKPYLMVDSALFDAVFRADLLKAIPDLDASMDGLLAHGDNFQALTLLTERYREKVTCVYIDPPYNTSSSSIPYKNTFKHSAWATMMNNRISKLAPLMPQDGAIFVSIDKHERTGLEHVLDLNLGDDNHVEELIWSMNTNNSQAPNYSTNHEYVLVYAKDRVLAEQDKSMFREPKPGFAEVMELVAKLNPTYPLIKEIESELKKLYHDHLIAYREEVEADGLDWDDEKKNDPWKGLYNYSNAEYRDSSGRIVNERQAEELKAKIWIWQEGDLSMPATKQSPTVHDPDHPNYRWYKPLHPVTNRETPHPKSGWKLAHERDPENLGKRSFRALDADGRIAWGPNETKVPRIKRMLHEVETNVGKSVFNDYSDGEKQTHALFNRSGVFLAPKHANFVARFVLHATKPDSTVLDCFGGSGSTGHAVLTTNRIDGGKRKYVLVEQGDYFNTVIKPRMQKVVYSADWKAGKPTGKETGISHAFKVLKIESYEDTLNNLTLKREAAQQGLLDRMGESVRDEYLMRYMLDVEARGSLLSVEDFATPFDLELDIAIDSAGATQRTKVDLLETFNYLIGLTVKAIDIQLRQGFATVEGTLPDGKRALILWRDCAKLDYDALTRLCDRLAINPGDTEYDVVYVNGDHNLPTRLQASEADGGEEKALNIRQIEPEFLSRMFDVADA